MNNIFKRSLAAITMLITGMAVMAQQKTMPQFGVRASFDMTTSVKLTGMTDFGPGASIGGSYMAPFGKMAFFQGSIYFAYNTIKYEGVSENKYNAYKVDGSIECIGLRLPLDIGLFCVNNDKFRLSVYTGPQFFINFSIKGKYDETRGGGTQHQDVKFTNSGMDIGWGLGIGADFNQRWHVHLEGMYALSNLCIEKLSSADLKRASISVGIGYNFNAPTKHGNRRSSNK